MCVAGLQLPLDDEDQQKEQEQKQEKEVEQEQEQEQQLREASATLLAVRAIGTPRINSAQSEIKWAALRFQV